MSIDWSKLAEIVENHERFLLVAHIRPDCDALGSQLAMAQILEARGKQARLVNGHPTPPNLAFIDPDRRIEVIDRDVTAEQLEGNFDVVMVLDTSAWAQIGALSDLIRNTTATKVVLDHHVAGDELGAIELKDTDAEATGRLVAEAAEQLGVPLTPQMAMPLFAAIATDTGWFRFGSVSSTTLTTAARLIDAGARPDAVYADLYERDTLGRVRLRGMILSRFTTELDGRLAHTYVRRDDFEAAGALPSDTEDVINMGLAIAGAEAAVIFVEQLDGGFKISFRSRCELNCAELAQQFGGGGHRAAAGAFVQQPFDQTQQVVLDAVRAAMQSGVDS